MGCVTNRKTSTIPIDDDFEIQRKKCSGKEKEFELIYLNYVYSVKNKANNKQRMGRYMDNMDGLRDIADEMLKELGTLEDIYNEQEKNGVLGDQVQKKKFIEVYKKSFTIKAEECKKALESIGSNTKDIKDQDEIKK